MRWLRRLAERSGKRIPVRLVKGAYWDSEIKWAQERALADYPVFTRKLHTDVSFLACVRLLLSDQKAFYSQFATHNAYAIAAAHVAGGPATFEFQRLHGMGEPLHNEVVGDKGLIKRPCRIYAPVGGHEDLLAYLVRRLLENGANTSFINRLADDEAPVSEIIRDPVEMAETERGSAVEPQRPFVRPRDIYLPERQAASGLPLTEPTVRLALFAEMGDALDDVFEAGPIIGGTATTGGDSASLVTCPHDRRERIGTVRMTTAAQADAAIARAVKAERDWNKLGGARRAQILAAAADLFERDKARLMAVIVREAGKTLDDAQGDVREAIDFLRYYAAQARRLFVGPVPLPGPTGERNTLTLHGRGVFACISPWNFPLAIFTGQIAAALAAGNAVVAKPAEQTPITAFLATKLLHEAGVPPNVLHLLPGSGRLGEALIKDTRISGVSFTGSNETGMGDPEGARRAPQRHRPVHRRDRRHQRHDRRLDRAPRAGGARRRALGVQQRRAALLGGARAVRAGGSRRPHDRHAGRRHPGARCRRSVRLCDRHRPRHRRGGAGRPRRPQDPHAARRPPARRPADARELPRRQLRHAGRLRDRRPRRARARGVRPHPARRPL